MSITEVSYFPSIEVGDKDHCYGVKLLFLAWAFVLVIFTEAVVRRCSIKQVFLKISQNSQEWMNFVKFLRRSFFTEHLWWQLLFLPELKCATRFVWQNISFVRILKFMLIELLLHSSADCLCSKVLQLSDGKKSCSSSILLSLPIPEVRQHAEYGIRKNVA